MKIALSSVLGSASIIQNIALLACVASVSLYGQTNSTATPQPKSSSTSSTTTKPATAPKPAAAGQSKAPVANSARLAPAAAQTPVQSAPAATKPNVAAGSPVPNRPTATSTPGAGPTTAPASNWSPTAAPQVSPATVRTPASAALPPVSSGGDPRTPVTGLGVGTFLWPGGWTLTAYGCFRTGTRLFCDFDTTNQNNLQANSGIWSGGGGVNLVDDGGKISPRHNAFFVGQDGSQFPTAYISPQPVRFIIEYDDVAENYTSISLVLGRERIQAVPITLIDPSQPAGRMPSRPAPSSVATSQSNTAPAATSAQSPAQPGAGILDKTTNGVNSANQQKKKAQSLWKSLQGAVQSH